MAVVTVVSATWGPGWLTVTSLAISVLSAAAVLAVAIARARAERRLEHYQLESRLRLKLAPIFRVDPTQIGVKLADSQQTILAGGALPQYCKRAIDAELRSAIERGLKGTDSWLVILAGTSTVGKSRTLFEALRVQAGTLALVAPENGDALRSILMPGQKVPTKGPAVLWLDDLEPFLSDGVTVQNLQEWQSGSPGRIVAATFGGKGAKRTPAADELEIAAGSVLQRAQLLELTASSAEEVASLRSTVSPAKYDEIERYGLAACLMGAKLLTAKLTAAGNSPDGPAGVAVLLTAVNWARCGRTDSIKHSRLRKLWPHHLKLWPNQLAAHVIPDEKSYEAGLAWALRPVTGPIALMSINEGYRANDYIIQRLQDEPRYGLPPDELWHEAIESATCEQATIVGEAAHLHARLGDAARAFTRGQDSSLNEMAARAGSNLGVVREEQKNFDSAITAYQGVIAGYADDPKPATREAVATALYRTARLLPWLGRSSEMLAAYWRVIASYAEDPSPETRRVVAQALVNSGIELTELGQADQAQANFERVITTYAGDTLARTREAVANALLNSAEALVAGGQLDQAQANFERVIAEYAEDADPRIRMRVGTALAGLGQREEALRSYRRIIADYEKDSNPKSGEIVATARRAAGGALLAMGEADAALIDFERIIADQAKRSNPESREAVATALLGAGLALRNLGQGDAALLSFQRVLADYAEDPHPRTREAVATALLQAGYLSEAVGQKNQAIAHFELAATKYAGDPNLDLRTVAARAAVSLAIVLEQLGQFEQAENRYGWVVTAYCDDPTPAIRCSVAGAMFNSGELYATLGRIDESLAIHQQLIATYAEDRAPQARECVAMALLNTAQRRMERGELYEHLAGCKRLLAEYVTDSGREARGAVALALVHAGLALGNPSAPNSATAPARPPRAGYSANDPTLAMHSRQAITLSTDGSASQQRNGLIEQLASGSKTSVQMNLLLRSLKALVLSTADQVFDKSGRPDAVKTAYQRVINTYCDDKVLTARIAVASALVNTAGLLNLEANNLQACNLYRRVIDTYADEPDPDMRHVVAIALEGLKEQAALEELIDAYSDDPGLGIRAVVASALIGVAEAQELKGHLKLAATTYRRVLDTYSLDPESSSVQINASTSVHLAASRLDRLLSQAQKDLE